MKEIEGVYTKCFELDCCNEHPLKQNEICPFHKRLAELDLKDALRDKFEEPCRVHIAYDLEKDSLTENKNKDCEIISYTDFKDRLVNDKSLLGLYIVVVEAKDFGIKQIASQVSVSSFDKNLTEKVFNLISG